MSNNSSNNNDAARDAGRTYRGHNIVIEEAGHPQVQNILIDGKPAGHAVFPADSQAIAEQIIDDRLRTRDFLNAAGLQIEQERNLKGEGRPAFEDNPATVNTRLDQLALRFDNGEFSDREYLIAITKAVTGFNH